MEAPYLYATYKENEDRYYAEIVVDTKVVEYKYLTNHEAEELDTWLQFLHGGTKDSITVPISELIEHIESGDIMLDEDSHLLDMLWETYFATA